MNEKEWVKRSREGDEEAFRYLFESARPKIFALCLKMTHDEKLAEDLTQETFLHAFHHLDSFRQEALFSTWAYRIARNLTLNHLKKKKGIQEEEFHEETMLPKKEKLFEQEGLKEAIEEGLKTL